jgi:murein DD-endopeptidase MepM/ murein hydrolase activator NlpD
MPRQSPAQEPLPRPQPQQLQREVQQLLNRMSRHRTGVAWAVTTALTGFGITAVAVAPLAPGAVTLPQRTVIESVAPQGLGGQLEALSNLDFSLSRSELTRASDTAASLLSRLGVRDAGALAFLQADSTARSLLAGRAGKMVTVRTRADGSLEDLVARFPVNDTELKKTHFTRLQVEKSGDTWRASKQDVAYGAALRMAGGSIRSSLFAATDEAGLPDAIATQLADIFASDIDMHRQLRKGDSFSVVYEALTADGQPVPWNDGVGRVTAAEFVNGGRAHHAVWFAQAGDRGSYFDLNGRSKRNAFLASPMEFSRVTSGFAMRMHPIFQTMRAHLGVDYAAPTGTPVRAVGAGVVQFAGRQQGYGNVVEIKHDGDRSTLYAHLNTIDVKVGQRIEQGQTVGGVGSTGWATGPHLHFEFRVKGVHQDPMLVAKASEATTLDTAARARFTQLSNQLQAKLDVAETLRGAHGTGE